MEIGLNLPVMVPGLDRDTVHAWCRRIDEGPFSIAALQPYALFGMNGLDPITHSLFWSMLVNLGALVGVSLLTGQSALERTQAALFVNALAQAEAGRLWRGTAQLADLKELVARFLESARSAFERREIGRL